MAELLPSIQAASNMILSLATSVNRLRGNASLLVDALRLVLTSIVPLSAAILIYANAVGIANLALRVFGATVAFLSGPIGWITAAIIALSAVWTLLGRSTREAAKEQEKFADQVRSMKMDELQTEIRETERLLSLLKQRYETVKESLSEEGDFNLFSVGKAKEADDLLKTIERTAARLGILRKAVDDINKAKIQPPILTPEDALKKLEAKLREVRAQILGLGDSTAGAKAALEAFIAETIRGVPVTGKLAAVIRELRLEFALLTALQQTRANVEAREKGIVSVAAAKAEAETAALKRSYDHGLVDLHAYHAERIKAISGQAEKEIQALENALARAKSPDQKITIQAEIEIKTIARDEKIAEEVQAEADAFRDLFSVISQGGLEQLVANNDLSMAHLQASYDDGLIDMKAFFAERRRIIEENAQATITNIETQIPGMDPKAAEDAKNKIAAIRAQMFSEAQKVNRDEILQVRANELEKFNIVAGFAQLKADASTGDLDRLRAQQEVEMAEIGRQHAEQLQRIQESKEELILVDGEYLTKKEALEKAQFDQAMVRLKTQADQERAVLQLRLQMASQVATGMQDLFGTLYEASGKKIKAFFYLEKAAAIANAIINTAQGVTKALAQGGIFGITMAGIITATGAAQIALIMAQTVKGFVKGGPVTSGSGRKDDVPAMLTKGEYVQPEPTVRHYGVGVMEVIRRMLIPKEVLQRAAAGFGFFPIARPQFAFAGGGEVFGGDVTDARRTTFNFPMTFNAPVSDRAVEKIHDGVERLVIQILKEETR
jgi:hypothetical protein